MSWYRGLHRACPWRKNRRSIGWYKDDNEIGPPLSGACKGGSDEQCGNSGKSVTIVRLCSPWDLGDWQQDVDAYYELTETTRNAGKYALHRLPFILSSNVCQEACVMCWVETTDVPVAYPWLEQNCAFLYFHRGVLAYECLVPEGWQNRLFLNAIRGCSTKQDVMTHLNFIDNYQNKKIRNMYNEICHMWFGVRWALTDRIGPDRGANRSTSILGAYNIFPRYIPLLDHRLRRVLGPHRQQPGQWVLFTYHI